MRLLFFSSSLLVILLVPRASHANPLDAFGFGSRGAAMGGAVAADVRDFSANYYNPAGLALAHGFELSIGYVDVVHSLSMNGQDNNVDPVKGLVAGAVVPGRVFGAPFAIGVGLYIPDDRLTRVRALPQSQPRWELYDNRNQRLVFDVDAAISPLPWLQLGGGVTYMAATRALLDITGDVDAGTPTDSLLRHQVDADLKLVAYPQFGARVQLSKRAALGLVYRGQFSLDLNIAANVGAGARLGATGSGMDITRIVLAMTSDTVDMFLPQQVVLGSSFEPIDGLHANFDLTWVNWSAYVPPVTHLGVNLDLPPPPGGWAQYGIKPPTSPAPIVVLPIEMHDRFVPHLGLEWRAIARSAWQGFLRAGYEFDKSPIGQQSGVTNYVDRDRHAVSAGLGVRLIAPSSVLPGDVRFDTHAQLSVLPTSTTVKTDPQDPIGDYTAGGHIWNVGLTATVGF
jgi:hypothetical protein